MKFTPVLILLLMYFCSSALALEKSDVVRFKPGSMGLLSFLEAVSEKLDLQIDASGLSGSDLGTVPVPDTGSLTQERAKALVLTLLTLQGYTWIHDAVTDVYRISHLKDARDQDIPIIADEASLPDSDLLVTYIMKVGHTPPDYIARIIRSFMPATSRIMSNDGMGAILITDSAHNISKLKNLIAHLDTPEVAIEARRFLIERAKKGDPSCPASSGGALIQEGVLIALFSLIALVIGFLSRGYVIRRIEGGL